MTRLGQRELARGGKGSKIGLILRAESGFEEPVLVALEGLKWPEQDGL